MTNQEFYEYVLDTVVRSKFIERCVKISHDKTYLVVDDDVIKTGPSILPESILSNKFSDYNDNPDWYANYNFLTVDNAYEIIKDQVRSVVISGNISCSSGKFITKQTKGDNFDNLLNGIVITYGEPEDNCSLTVRRNNQKQTKPMNEPCKTCTHSCNYSQVLMCADNDFSYYEPIATKTIVPPEGKVVDVDATIKNLSVGDFTVVFKDKEITWEEIKNTIVYQTNNELDRECAINKLRTIAKYFNRDWKSNPENTGYTIQKDNVDIKPVNMSANWPTAGTVYFKDEKSALEAIRIMGDGITCLF